MAKGNAHQPRWKGVKLIKEVGIRRLGKYLLFTVRAAGVCGPGSLKARKIAEALSDFQRASRFISCVDMWVACVAYRRSAR